MSIALIEALEAEGLTAEAIIRVLKASARRVDPTNAERQARYRERKDVSESEWHYLREQVFIRDNFTCTYCGSEEDLACDHVVPLIQGGKSTMENLTTACRSCNCEKAGRTPVEWLA